MLSLKLNRQASNLVPQVLVKMTFDLDIIMNLTEVKAFLTGLLSLEEKILPLVLYICMYFVERQWK